MTRDANELAREFDRAQRQGLGVPVNVSARQPPRGTLTVYESLWRAESNFPATNTSNNVFLDMSKPGCIIAYDPDGFAEIFYPQPGWYVTFEPHREGE